MNSKIPYLVKNSLEIEVYVIGYKTMGESIILFIKLDSKIVFSVVIDSYKYNGVNKTIELLKENNVDRIDYLCWSHPDDDHSRGMVDIICNFVDENTLINIPAKIDINKENCSQSTKEVFKELQENVKTRNKYKVYEISDIMDILGYEELFQINHNDIVYPLIMKAIAPNSNLSWQEHNNG